MGTFGNIKSETEFAEKNNLAAIIAPVVGNDGTQGYQVGSQWIDTVAQKEYVCVDASVGAAIWTETTQSGGGSNLQEASGLIDGAALSVNGGDNTKFDLSAGTGQVVDAKTTPATPTITPVTIVGGTAITVTNLATQFFTYILVDDLGAIVQQGTPPTSVQLRTHIYIGKLNHANQINLASALNAPSLAIGTSSGLEDLMLEAIGVINATPMVVSSGGANLNFDISAGDLWQLGINYDGDKNKPHTLSYATYDSSVVPFVYTLSDTTIIGPNNVLIPGSYESPLGTITGVGANNWTNQRVYKTLTGNVLVMYGQTEYNSKALALEGLYNEVHSTPDILTSGEAVLIGIITINQGATDTSDDGEVVFQQASKFGEFGKGSAGVSTGSLQNSYDNSIEPEILTDDVRGALSLRRGSTGGDTDVVWEILNGAGDIVATVDGNGTLSSGGTTNSTGVLSGGELSVGAGGPGVATTYDITDGTGHIVTSGGVRAEVSWTGLTGEIPIFGPSVITFVAINSGGTVTQQSTPFSRVQSRTLIPLGVIVHVNGVNVDTINNEQEIAYNPMASLYDAMESIGFFNVSGNVFGANGANMTINKSLGSLFKMGSNYDTAPTDNPHVRTNAATSGGIFQYRFSDGTSGSLTETNIDPDNLDDGAGGLTAVGNNQWSVQRIYIFTSNNIKIQRGVSSYSSSDAAIQGITTEPYITETSLTANALFRGWLIIKKGATVLNGVDAIFLSSGKFGESGGSVGSGSTTTLQAAYDNSSDSEIVIPSGAANAFSLEADTDGAEIVQDWKDETQTVKASMTGDGNLAVVDVNGVALTTAGAATNFLNETGAYSVPPGGVGSADVGPRSVVATAGAVWSFVGDELVWETNDGNSVASYWSYTVQKDYVSGGTLDIWIRATGTGDASPVVADMTAWIDNVVDATINTLSIIPSVDSTWEKITITFGSTLAIGDVINLQLDTDTSVNPGIKLIQIKAMIFNYN